VEPDPRVVRVETSVADFYRVVATAPGITTTAYGAVTTFVSGLPHPLLNGVLADAPLEAGTEQECVGEAIGPLQSSGTPFLWWCGPTVWSAGLERALTTRGVIVEALPGMHRPLDRQLDRQLDQPPAPPRRSDAHPGGRRTSRRVHPGDGRGLRPAP